MKRLKDAFDEGHVILDLDASDILYGGEKVWRLAGE
jgi:hypothetical protein